MEKPFEVIPLPKLADFLSRISEKHRRTIRFSELSYASNEDAKWKQLLIRGIEQASGREFLADRYEVWRKQAQKHPEVAMTNMLGILNTGLNLHGELPGPERMDGQPLIVVANHPFGIGDGVAILSLAERLNRPFKILINQELLKIPEIRPYALPISFAETKAALMTNLETRKQARKLLADGYTVVIFPSGGVATAQKGFGKAKDLPWKKFAARLVQASRANVLPVFFEGQCSRSFHIASKISPTLRTALLIREFRQLAGKQITVRVGSLIEGDVLAEVRCREELTQRLYDEVFSLEGLQMSAHQTASRRGKGAIVPSASAKQNRLAA